MNIYKKLFEVQQNLKAPKNLYNKFGNYNYRSAESILEAVKPLLNEQKVILLINDEMIEVGGKNYIKATAKFIDIESGESIENSALAREEEFKKGMDTSQITGSCSSYARKYALNGLFMIDDVKDSDTTNKHGKDEVKTEPNQKVYAGEASKDANVKNIWTKAEASETDNVIPLEKSADETITKNEMMFIYSRGFQAGYTQEQVKNHIIKKFNKTIEQLTKKECMTIVEGYQNIILKKVEG